VASKALVRGGAVGVVVALTAGAWFAGRQIESPGEAAATAEPPPASRITAPVEERVLESTVIVRGLVRYGDPRPVSLAASALKAAAAQGTQILSSPAEKGGSLDEGAVALGVGGRPVFVLRGDLPAYRDLRPGDEGVDVRQLEAALDRLGFSPGPLDGRYDAATEAAAERWYDAAGYDAFGPTDQQRAQLRTARTALATADDALASARRALTQAERGTSGDKLVAAREQLTSAQERAEAARDDAERNVTRAVAERDARDGALALARSQADIARQALERTRRDATDASTVGDARDGVATARSQLRQAQAALDEAISQVPLAEAAAADARVARDQAKSDLDTTKSTNPTTLGPDGVIRVLDNTAQVRQAEAGLRQADAALRQAEANVGAAQRAIESRRAAVTDAERGVARAEAAVTKASTALGDRAIGVTEAEQRLRTAEADLARAERDLAAAISGVASAERSSAAAVRQADGAVEVAAAQLRSLRSGAEVEAADAQVASADRARNRAADELADLEAEVGIVVPANEVLFFATLPLRVDEVRAQRGDVVTGPVMTVTTDRLAVDSSVDTVEAKLVKQGARVVIESSEFDVELEGTVTEIASAPGTKGVDPSKVYLEVTPTASASSASTGAVQARDLNGSSVKLTIPITSTGTAVLAVPVAGVSVAADGTSRVEVEDDPSAATRFVTVRTGISAEGYVAVTPIGGALTAGDQVVVGNRDATAIDGSLAESAEVPGAEPSDEGPSDEEPSDEEPSTDPSVTDGSPATDA
jgi:peptidoglycan hydrolase-like protein with peptidoglycan-binding domain